MSLSALLAEVRPEIERILGRDVGHEAPADTIRDLVRLIERKDEEQKIKNIIAQLEDIKKNHHPMKTKHLSSAILSLRIQIEE